MVWREGDPLTPTNLNRIYGTAYSVTESAFQAVGDGVTDNYSSLQSAIDTACAAADQGGTRTVFFPPGRYLTSQPLWVHSPGVQIVGSYQGIGTRFSGSHAGASELVGTFAGGPLLLVADSSASFSGITTQLLTGSGSAWSQTNNNCWLNLRDAITLDLHGATALTVEATYRSASSANVNVLVSSMGKYLQNDPANTAFALTNNGGVPTFQVVTSAGTATLSGSVFTVGQSLHAAGVWSGTTAYLFVGGSLVTSTALGGTLVQNFAEDVTVGPQFSLAPEQFLLNGGPGGTLDSVRISDNARYTAAFSAPTAKFSNDSHTLALLNFDNQVGPMTRMYTKNGDAWIVQRDSTFNGNCYGFGVRGMTLESEPISYNTLIVLIGNTQWWSLDHCNFINYRNGLLALMKNKFQWRMEYLYCEPFAVPRDRYTLAFGSNGGIGEIDTAWFFGGAVGLYAAISTIDINNLFVNGESDVHCPIILVGQNTSGNPIALNNVVVNGESGFNADYRAAMLVGGVIAGNGVHAQNSTFEGGGTSTPFIIADSVDFLEFSNCNFVKGTGNPTSILSVIGALGRPATFRHCFQGTFVPWTDTAGTAVANNEGAQHVSWASTLSFDASRYQTFDVPLLGNISASSVINATNGQRIVFSFTQDSVGSCTVASPTSVSGFGSVAQGHHIVSSQEFLMKGDTAVPIASLATVQLAGSAFSPPAPGNLKLWLNASQLSTTYSDNSSVITWVDSSGLGFDVSQATAASQPVFKTNVVNGQPVVRFDGSDDLLSNNTFFDLADNYTVFVVSAWTNTTNGRFVQVNNSSQQSGFAFLSNDTPNGLRFACVDGAATVAANSVVTYSDATFRVLTGLANGVGSPVKAFVNGSLVATSSSNYTPANTQTLSLLNVGSNNGGEVLRGDLAEVLIYASSLTQTQQRLVERYLGFKYGITIT